jgi:hypothetical protein
VDKVDTTINDSQEGMVAMRKVGLEEINAAMRASQKKWKLQ